MKTLSCMPAGSGLNSTGANNDPPHDPKAPGRADQDESACRERALSTTKMRSRCGMSAERC